MSISPELQKILEQIPAPKKARSIEDLLSKLPDFSSLPDEMQLGHIYRNPEIDLGGRLQQAGLTKGQRAAVSNAFEAAELVKGHWLTVGEIRALPDEELVKLKRLGSKRIRILRKLFGHHQED